MTCSPNAQAGTRKAVLTNTEEDSPRDSDDVGCLSFLKRITCTLSCGGTTCSIKETEPVTSSSSESESLSPSSSSGARAPSLNTLDLSEVARPSQPASQAVPVAAVVGKASRKRKTPVKVPPTAPAKEPRRQGQPGGASSRKAKKESARSSSCFSLGSRRSGRRRRNRSSRSTPIDRKVRGWGRASHVSPTHGTILCHHSPVE